MAATTQLTIPPTSLPVGTIGPLTTPTLPANVAAYQLTTVPVVWPASGDVLQLIVEESPDNGATWLFSASNSLSSVNGGMGTDKLGNPITADVWTFTPMFRGTTVKLRLTLRVLQACRISGSVVSL